MPKVNKFTSKYAPNFIYRINYTRAGNKDVIKTIKCVSFYYFII